MPARGAGGPRASWRARAGRGRRPPTPRRPPRSARGRSAGRRRARRCEPRRRGRPPSSCRPSAPPRAPRARAHAARPSHSPGPPSSSRYSAIDPTPSSIRQELQIVGGASTAWLPLATTVWNRRPRRVASAFTATLPLCEISATAPGSRGVSASPHSAVRVCVATIPLQLGPHTGQAVTRRPPRQGRACNPTPPATSANPALNTTAPPHPRAPACSTQRARPPPGSTTTTASTALG